MNFYEFLRILSVLTPALIALQKLKKLYLKKIISHAWGDKDNIVNIHLNVSYEVQHLFDIRRKIDKYEVQNNSMKNLLLYIKI